MKIKTKPITYSLLAMIFLLTSCYNQERNCKDFKTGKFKSEIEVDGKKFITTFERNDSIQIETYEGITDSYDVRWTNNCEYIIKNSQPKNMAEKKALQVKILTTSINSYTFEYNFVGEAIKQKGIVYKLD
ncbi:DNA topoisomerase IV [uncultured Flavobacterium sp.]|uniref:DNA topoisomerase IV n=1 Tax=uncultured Flavobacterium sp. TaxID=165435 RepID=UPI0030EE93A4|tara:strand:- start:298 stop:687 length:390 start_codon:yes stop_codon:yes gene_type:complete